MNVFHSLCFAFCFFPLRQCKIGVFQVLVVLCVLGSRTGLTCSSLSEPELFLPNPFVALSLTFICFAFSHPLFCHHFQLLGVCSLTAQIQLAPFTRCFPSNDGFVQSGWWLKAVIIMHVSCCSHSLSLRRLIALYSDWHRGSRVLPLQWRTSPSVYPPIYPPTVLSSNDSHKPPATGSYNC